MRNFCIILLLQKINTFLLQRFPPFMLGSKVLRTKKNLYLIKILFLIWDRVRPSPLTEEAVPTHTKKPFIRPK